MSLQGNTYAPRQKKEVYFDFSDFIRPQAPHPLVQKSGEITPRLRCRLRAPRHTALIVNYRGALSSTTLAGDK
ncbi:unnamed protein product [Ceratitis capitata]|uniref:(Mediterranean fruit fly) hypothetical protein n=1 Tax=Ceratitis capitata TaxID=7213 RepID=A0A811VFD0_CERCA|nr:unnamed protein product [Ceratitis capitata]